MRPRADILLDIVGLLRRHTRAEVEQTPFPTPIPGLTLMRADHGRHPRHVLHRPALCLVAQGAKETRFGTRTLTYSAGQAMMVSMTMPGVSHIERASVAEPYLGVAIEFEPSILREVLAAIGPTPLPIDREDRGAFTLECGADLLDCVLRTVRLLDQPEAVVALYPAVMRELCYLLLVGPHGSSIARSVAGEARPDRIVAAIQVLREQFDQPLAVSALADRSQLSPSAFHRRFKALTGTTPLAYQKLLRLMEARHLMITEQLSAEGAAFRVGYNSASQFNREYSRTFGATPKRDAARGVSQAGQVGTDPG